MTPSWRAPRTSPAPPETARQEHGGRLAIARALAPGRGTTRDVLFLTAVTAVVPMLYVWNLGFYSDDWYFIAAMRHAPDDSLMGLASAIWYSASRPVHALYLAALYGAFGVAPLPYHLINGAVLIATVVCFYLVLAELGLPRLWAVAVPLIYAFLPHYSTTRFWIAAAHFNLSMALYFVSLYADLRTLRSRPEARWRWKTVAITSLAAGVLACEVAVPLFALSLGLLHYRAHISRRTSGSLLWVNAIALSALAIFKVLTNARALVENDYVSRAATVLRQSIAVAFGPNGFGVGLPVAVLTVLREHVTMAMLIAAGLLSVTIYVYLLKVSGEMRRERVPARRYLIMCCVGLGIFVLGYALAFLTPEVSFSVSGVVNRTAIAPAVGVAVCLWGGINWVSALVPERHQQRAVAALVTVLCVSGFLVVSALGSFWTAAYEQQTRVLREMRQTTPTLPDRSTVILDGICSYVGPAVVFEAHWDVSGALRVLYDNPAVRGNVVTRRLSTGPEGLSAYIYSSVPGDAASTDAGLTHCCQQYQYDDKLFIYNASQRRLFPLVNHDAARAYFAGVSPDVATRCAGREGYGTPVFW